MLNDRQQLERRATAYEGEIVAEVVMRIQPPQPNAVIVPEGLRGNWRACVGSRSPLMKSPTSPQGIPRCR